MPPVPPRFRLQLGGPRAEALERSRRRAQQEPLEELPESALELDPDAVYGHGQPGGHWGWGVTTGTGQGSLRRGSGH